MAKENREPGQTEFGIAFRTVVCCALLTFLFGAGLILVDCVKGIHLIPLGIVQMSVAVLIFVIGYWNVRKHRRRFLDYLENFSFSSENTIKTAILNFNSPVVVTAESGSVRWYNPMFSNMVGKRHLFGEYLQDLLPQFQISRFVEDDNPSPEEVEYKGRTYTVSGKVVRTAQEGKTDALLGLCFTDITDEKAFRKTFEEKRLVECIAIIDNYDEVFKETPNTNHGALIGEIDRCISTWVEMAHGILRRYERDKYFILFEYGYFEQLIKEKFSVLSVVRNIQMENKIPVTLSIGVGIQGETLQENDKMARLALDMALGRGGDQAVVKNPYAFSFYGAKSREIEKGSKVKARVVAHALREMIDQASNVIIMGHKSGDMDSLGAAIGLFRVVKSRGKNGYIALNRASTNAKILLSHFTEMPEYDSSIISGERALNLMDDKTLVIIVDTHRPSMVEYEKVLKESESVVLIDHHRRSEDFIENAVLTYHEPYASSTSEMVTEIIQYIQDTQRLNVKEAEALYSGIYMDTKGFTFKTGVRTFETAAYLRRLGVDPVNIKRLFRNDISLYVQKSKIITHAKVYRGNIAIAICENESRDLQVVVAQAADDLLNIAGIEASFVLAKVGNKIIISGRSLESVNVQVILEKLGGGGHITIAGAQLENSGLAAAEAKLKFAIDEVLFDE